jgi:N-acetylneuraminate synthase/N,N'-diacetyllegionaminate synthase
MKIGSFDLDQKVMVIAEIGNNHEGNFNLACDLIGLAAQAGADAVKFQTIVPDMLVSPDQIQRIKQLQRFQLTYDHFIELKRIADQGKVIFLSTPFDLESAVFLNDMVPAFKIASGDISFYRLLDVVAGTGKPIILSTGASTLDEVKKAKERIENIWRTESISQEMAILHCVATYPAPLKDVNLKCLQTLRALDVTVGYSDHTMGMDASVLSVALGARIIEKHFTMDKKYSNFRDHSLSADPIEFNEMVRRIRTAEDILGDGEKCPRGCEIESLQAVRRSIVAKDGLTKGHCIGQSDINWIRPGTGLPPGQEDQILGRRLKRDLRKGEPILLSDLDEEN